LGPFISCEENKHGQSSQGQTVNYSLKKFYRMEHGKENVTNLFSGKTLEI
jgi:hypothetical protein